MHDGDVIRSVIVFDRWFRHDFKMQLVRITGQSKESLRQFYDLSHGWAGHWLKPIEAMLALVIYLEKVEFSPQYVFTSHENLIFSGQDDHRQWLVSVHPLEEIHEGPARAKYEIRRPLETPWAYASGYAVDEQEAWQLIASALTHRIDS